jgi:hypothetical protein
LNDDRPAARFAGRVIAHDVRAARGFEMRWHPQFFAVRNFNRRTREVQSDNWHILSERSRQQHRHFVVFPGMHVDDLSFGEELRRAGRKDTKVSPTVVSSLRTRVSRDPDHFADLPLDGR